jgi:hypothetical protein
LLLKHLRPSVFIAAHNSSRHLSLTASVVLLGGNEVGVFFTSFSFSFFSGSLGLSSLSLDPVLDFLELLGGVSLPVPKQLTFFQEEYLSKNKILKDIKISSLNLTCSQVIKTYQWIIAVNEPKFFLSKYGLSDVNAHASSVSLCPFSLEVMFIKIEEMNCLPKSQ